MNILIPHPWLLEHLETKTQPDKIRELVSLCGPSIERIYEREGENVYDIEVTTNRVDSMSIRGIAREVAVILDQFGESAKLKKLTLPKISQDQGSNLPLPKITNDEALCKRITCVVLDQVKRTPTPDWMAKRLVQTDMNVHDSVIDITNYITHELGHPCHAFDYDKLMKTGGEIIVTTAKKGEHFATLDGNEFETVGGEVVFQNGQGEIIDLPSIKGTANTSIDNSTTRVLLLLESIVAQKVRFASMSHAIRTTAAQLMEKNVDPNLIIPTLELGVKLYQELCQAKVASTVYDDFPNQNPTQPIATKLETINNYLGVSLDEDVIVTILEKLGCEVLRKDKDKVIVVTPPTFRPDLEIAADIVEEIARIYGYHRLPSKLMDTAIPLDKPKHTNFEVENKIKHFLVDRGWQEIYSYSLVSEVLAGQSGYPLEDHLKLQNPLTEDRVYLRRSLIPSLVEVIESNPLEKQLAVFELANVYHPEAKQKLPTEELHLTLVTLRSYRETRGAVEALLRQFFIENLEIDGKGQLSIEKNKIGEVRQEGELIAVDIIIAKLLPLVKKHPTYQPIAKTSFIAEDITLTLLESVAVGEVIKTIKNQSSLIEKVELIDQYQQNYTFAIKYHDPNKNLSNTDIEPVREKIFAGVTNMVAKNV